MPKPNVAVLAGRQVGDGMAVAIAAEKKGHTPANSFVTSLPYYASLDMASM